MILRMIAHIVLYEILQGKVLNFLMFPVAYLFRDKVREGGFLWGFLHDGNLYGDSDYLPKIKNKFLRAYLWALRNPLHNRYNYNSIPYKDTNFSGWATGKLRISPKSWRTFVTDTGGRNGDIIDFDNSLFGKQDIAFSMTHENKSKRGIRKSLCVPFKIFGLIIIHSRRFGYEKGLLQSSFNFSFFSGRKNKENFEIWSNDTWQKETL